jgi:hypothetical protein
MRSSFMLVYVQKQHVELEDSLIGVGGLRRVYKGMTGCGIGADHLSFGKSFSRWKWVSMMLKALAKAKWLLVLLKFEIYVGGRAKICICAFHSPFLSLSFPLLLPPFVFGFTTLNFQAVVD